MSRTRADLIRDRYGVSTQTNLVGLAASVGLTPVQLLKGSPNRLALTIINTGTGILYVFPRLDVSANQGIVLAPGGGVINLTWDSDFDTVGLEWWAVSTVAAQPYTLIEVVAI